MGLAAKAKAKGSREGWGMGFLFVFLPDDNNNNNNHHPFTLSPPSCSSSSSSSSSSPSSSPFSALLRRTNSYHLLSTAQSTIYICALLFFVTVLLFTLSTLDPPSSSHHRHLVIPRRNLSSIHTITPTPKTNSKQTTSSHALQGMGRLYRRGMRAMNDLIVAHIAESLTANELRIFLRLLHRSDLTSRSDVLFISSRSSPFDTVIAEENDSFLKLIDSYLNATEPTREGGFDVTQFVKHGNNDKESKEPIWGRKIRGDSVAVKGTESTRPSYGSVVSFEAEELDPENTLGGFLDHVAMGLRRWACYPMLLGRVRRNFKHVMLVDVKEVLISGDPLVRVRNRSPEMVYLSTTTHHSNSGSKRGRKNSDRTQQKRSVSPAVVMGGARGVRRLSNAMLTEIAREAMQQQHKKKNTVNELALFNQLVANNNLLKNVDLITSTESVHELSSLVELLKSKSRLPSSSISKFPVVRRGNGNNIALDSAIMKHICSFSLDSKVYSDCL